MTARIVQHGRYVEVSVNGHVTRFKVDSGADVTVVPPSLPGVPRKLDAVEGELIGPGNQPLPVLGTFQATLAWKDKRTVQQLYVMRAQTTPLLGLPAIEALGVVKFVNTTSAESGKTDGRVPSSDARRFRAQDSRNKVRQARDFNRRHNARSLNPLKPGDSVWVTDASCQARVLSPAQRPRSYVVETPKGILQRNRRHLVPFSPTVTARESVELPAAEEPPGQPPEEGQPGELPTAGCSSPSLDRASSPQGVTRSRYGRAIKPPRRLDL
ncbi:uncharacterized protein ISCGN_026398 [Ixodes scapularis]